MKMVESLTHTLNNCENNKNPFFGEENAQNILIQGDNLHILSSLLPLYKEKVKCIYIDPPYNTKKNFYCFSDNFSHEQWLKMMSERLEILHKYLREDGSIWVSIDDNECHYLKMLMDKIFLRKNFIANCIWQRTTGINMSTKLLSKNHDHILVYAKNRGKVKINNPSRSSFHNAKYTNPDFHPKGAWLAENLYCRTGNHKNSHENFEHTFSNGITWRPPFGRFSKFSHERLEEFEKNNEIWFGADLQTKPSRKRFLSDVLTTSPYIPLHTLWLREQVGDTHEARSELRKLSSQLYFDTPKPERLIRQILSIATDPKDLVLDCFLGSGTTAAVALKMQRKFIGIEKNEQGRTTTISRLLKVIEGEQGGVSKTEDWHGGGGFQFFEFIGGINDQNERDRN